MADVPPGFKVQPETNPVPNTPFVQVVTPQSTPRRRPNVVPHRRSDFCSEREITQQAPPPKTLRIIINLTDPEPTKPGTNPATEHVVPDIFDERTVSEIRNLVHAIVRGDYLQQEREDYLQETLIHLWQIMKADPAQDAGSHLVRCQGFIRDRLKHGRSVDSLKRRRLGRSIEAMDFRRSCEKIPQLVTNSTPHHHASDRDAAEQLRVRLKSREQRILLLFLEGNGTREVARRLHVCASVVSKGARRIRAVALEIGLRPGVTSRRKNKKQKSEFFCERLAEKIPYTYRGIRSRGR